MPEVPDSAKTLPLERLERVFHARYRLLAEIDRGGMGVVWRAEDMKLKRTVALKFLPDLVVHDRETMADLAAETRRCLELTHPHIVRVYDFVEESDQAAISMEFVDGPSLADRKLAQPARCFTPESLVPWVAQLCSALEYAHNKAGIVHRDLKPLNLLVNSDGDLKVVDFGIARSLRESDTARSDNQRSSGVSLSYAGPQQLRGEPAAVSDDIYTLGATLYEMLTSKAPFYEGDIFAQVREVVPPKMAARRKELGIEGRGSIPVAWESTVAACLAKDAADRPRSAAEVAARLGIALPGSPRHGGSAKTISRTWIAIGATAALALLAGVFWPHPVSSPDVARSPASGGASPRAAAPTSAGPAAPARGFVVSVEPPDSGARVWLGPRSELIVPADGHLEVGDVPEGEHDLIVQAAGYQPRTTRVTVRDGRGNAQVQLTAVHGIVEIVARPGTTVMAIDARGRRHPLGTVPAGGVLRAEQSLTVGTYTFLLTHPDCGDIQQAHVPLAVGRAARIALPQMPLPGELRVFSVPAGADVFVNGTKAGVTPITLPAQPSEKPLAIAVALAGHRRFSRTVTLLPRETSTIDTGTLQPESGGIEFRLADAPFQLPDAVIRIDGREGTLTQGRIANLETGVRNVEISHPSYEVWQQAVTVRDGPPVRTAVQLKAKPSVLTLSVTEPAAYKLTVDGKVVPVKNNRVSLPAEKKLALEISASGFKTDRRVLTLPPAGSASLAVRLDRIPVAEVGKSWTIPNLDTVLVPVAPGGFVMGSENGEENERPVTPVTVKQAFWLGRTEVTQAEWRVLMGDADRSRYKGDNLPVQNVTWHEAMEFCRKLTARERQADRLPADYVYSLPTEAQWEYACRAGTKGDFSGNLADMAWDAANSGDAPHPVATRQPNAWGLHDMHGNVWEWCADAYSKTVVDTPKAARKGQGAGTTRVRRGGSWVVNARYLRSSIRGFSESEYRNFNIGFRLALVPAD